MKKIIPHFAPLDWLIWGSSVLFVVLSYLIFPQSDPFSMIGSVIGVTALIFVAKGAVIGQFFMLIFCLFYGILSFFFQYYGEMLTYLGMSLPAVIFNIVSWLRHPWRDTAQVTVAPLTKSRFLACFSLTVLVTTIFYFLLKYLGTAELLISTVSVATSVMAASLSFIRSFWYAMAYAANDVVLVILWSIACSKDMSAIPVLVCFAVFLINDLHGFFSWRKMKKQQEMQNQTKKAALS